LNKIKLTIAFVAISISQFAFAGMFQIVEIFSYQSKTIDAPEVGEEIEVEIGESITSRALLTRKPGIKITLAVKSEVSIFPFSYPINLPVNAELPLYAKSDNGMIYFKSGIGTVGKVESASPAIFIPNNKNEPVEICFTDGILKVFAQCNRDPKITIGSVLKFTNINELSEESFKRELIYLGGNSNSIQLGYREFKNDYARAAFSQDLKFDISEDKMIGFKGARFEVKKATNTSLIVKVIKHLI